MSEGERKRRERVLRNAHHTELDAVLAGRVLSGITGVLGVELFGSTARRAKKEEVGRGNDLDFLILVSPEHAELYRSYVRREKISTPSLRLEAAGKVLGKEFLIAVKQMKRSRPHSRFDFILIEENWRSLLPYMHINDYSQMLRRIGEDAMPLE